MFSQGFPFLLCNCKKLHLLSAMLHFALYLLSCIVCVFDLLLTSTNISFFFSLFSFFFIKSEEKRNIGQTKKKKYAQKMRRPGVEPGSIPWEGTIMPLDQRRHQKIKQLIFVAQTILR